MKIIIKKNFLLSQFMNYFENFPLICSNCIGSKKYVNIYKSTELKTCLVTGKKFTSFDLKYEYNYIKKTIICQDFAFIKQICQV
mmetsp:Transcript_4285/g.8622  ORF Transcript_4285/g.8622 Transcript_4285/m.8622 type:complete len:84 (+) Transcript_4285:409-660(+)